MHSHSNTAVSPAPTFRAPVSPPYAGLKRNVRACLSGPKHTGDGGALCGQTEWE